MLPRHHIFLLLERTKSRGHSRTRAGDSASESRGAQGLVKFGFGHYPIKLLINTAIAYTFNCH